MLWLQKKVISASNEQNALVPVQTLSDILQIDDSWTQSNTAKIARYKGILTAKESALKSVSRVSNVGKILSWPIVFVSGIHVWETMSTFRPDVVPALPLPEWVYYTSAGLFTVVIDIAIVYIVKAYSLASYTKKVVNPSQLIFFYAVTCLLNAAFIISHTGTLTTEVRITLSNFFSVMFAILLPLFVPLSLYTIEEANKLLETVRLSLIVDTETLKGMLQPTKREHVIVPEDKDQESSEIQVRIPMWPCPKCSAMLAKGEHMLAHRKFKAGATKCCTFCKESEV